MNLLVVENSALVRDRLIRTFSGWDNVRIVGAASTAAEAIQMGLRTHPDVVLLDIFLDHGSGYQVLQALKKRTPSPVVIVMTNYTDMQHRKKYLQAGADHFFDKVMEFDLLLQTIQQLRYRLPQKHASTMPHFPVVHS